MAEKASRKKKPRRIAVDANQIDPPLDDDELRQLLQVPEDIWARMPDSEKAIILMQRGIDASRAALEEND